MQPCRNLQQPRLLTLKDVGIKEITIYKYKKGIEHWKWYDIKVVLNK